MIPYYKLATFEARFLTFRDGKTAYNTLDEARQAAKAPGKYRVSKVSDAGREDFEPFEVQGQARKAGRKITYGKEASRPMGGRPH